MTPEQKQKRLISEIEARHEQRKATMRGEGEASWSPLEAHADVGRLLSLVKEQEAGRERLLNLVRYCRHELLEKDLITRSEFAALLEEGSAACLETYDGLRAQIDSTATSMRSACVEKVKAVALTEREMKRIGSQIVGDVLAQMGVRGSKEEREGADVVATAWVAKIVERVSEESAVKLESLSIEKQEGSL